MSPGEVLTAAEWGLKIAEAAFKVAREIKDGPLRREAMRIARENQSDQKVLLDLELQEMLDERYPK